MTVLERVPTSPAEWSARAAEAGSSWEAAGWSAGGQRERLGKVVEVLAPAAGESLLDFGCGTGELAAYVGADVDYVGYDYAAGMIARARVEHPTCTFAVVEPTCSFDCVAAIGPFNLGDKLLAWAALRRLWDRTRRALAVSLYAGDDERCLIYSEDEVLKFARGEAFHHRVERWRHNDILMVLERS